MNFPSKNKPYFSFPNFDISYFAPEDFGLNFGMRVYVPLHTTIIFTPFVAVIVNRKQYEFFTISEEPKHKRKRQALLSDENTRNIINWIKLNHIALLEHWSSKISTFGLCKSLVNVKGANVWNERNWTT